MKVTRQLRASPRPVAVTGARTVCVPSPMRTVPVTPIDCSNRLAGYSSLPTSLPVPVP